MTNEITSYDKADAKLKTEMDAIIAGMTDSTESVRAYGQHTLEKFDACLKSGDDSDLYKIDEVFTAEEKIGSVESRKAASELRMNLFKEFEKKQATISECVKEAALYCAAAPEIAKSGVLAEHFDGFLYRVDLLAKTHRQGMSLLETLRHTTKEMKSLAEAAEQPKKKPDQGFKP
jgi:hypothetical protein